MASDVKDVGVIQISDLYVNQFLQTSVVLARVWKHAVRAPTLLFTAGKRACKHEVRVYFLETNGVPVGA